MTHSTTNTYTLKREILTFSNKIFRKLSKPERKFSADMTYGMLASDSCLLTDIVVQLHEEAKKVNSVERLTRHLNKGISGKALNSYLSVIRRWVPDEPVVHIDDSDIVKPDGHKFEALGLVRDSSKSTDVKNVYEKVCHVTFSAMERGISISTSPYVWHFCCYRLAKGIRGILAFAREGPGFGSGLSVRLTDNCACGY